MNVTNDCCCCTALMYIHIELGKITTYYRCKCMQISFLQKFSPKLLCSSQVSAIFNHMRHSVDWRHLERLLMERKVNTYWMNSLIEWMFWSVLQNIAWTIADAANTYAYSPYAIRRAICHFPFEHEHNTCLGVCNGFFPSSSKS